MGERGLKCKRPLDTNDLKARRAREAAKAIGGLVRQGFKLCATHGNGPQVGLLAYQAPDISLDVLGAESQGQIGYLLESELSDELPDSQVVALLTQVKVDPRDEAFYHPTNFLGPSFTKEAAETITQEKGLIMKPDGKHGYRRVVASPKPILILEEDAIKVLLKESIIVICIGGGGVPVVFEAGDDGKTWRRHGVEAVIDKDAASALLAAQIKADFLLLLTDADAVYDPAKWPDKISAVPSPITPDQLFQMGSFASGSMAPKIAAACDFVRQTGKPAGIGALADALGIVKGERGTLIVPS